jgi:hypothetical protein
MQKILLPLLVLIVFIVSCQSKDEKDKLKYRNWTVEMLNQENDELKKKLGQLNDQYEKDLQRLKEQNQELSNQLTDARNLFDIKEHIENNEFLTDSMNTSISILRTGEFHGDEISEDAEKRDWYGLIRQGSRTALKKTRIRIDICHDPIVDKGEQSTGKKVSAADIEKPILLISGLSNVREDFIQSAEIRNDHLYPGETMSFKLNDQWMTISAHGYSIPGEPLRSYMLQISLTDNPKVNQIFAGSDRFDDAIFKFIWAGDLDRDGALDLIMDLTNHYNVSRIVLFLSSMAEEGQLLKPVAVLTTVGC